MCVRAFAWVGLNESPAATTQGNTCHGQGINFDPKHAESHTRNWFVIWMNAWIDLTDLFLSGWIQTYCINKSQQFEVRGFTSRVFTHIQSPFWRHFPSFGGTAGVVSFFFSRGQEIRMYRIYQALLKYLVDFPTKHLDFYKEICNFNSIAAYVKT